MFQALDNRYSEMKYRRSGNSGLLLPEVSLGLWQNFGASDSLENSGNIIKTAFDLGITHFDLANNYGPPPGAAELTFGKIFSNDLKPYRDELVISTKAGYNMWPGPYGEWGSKKHLISSLDQSLSRMKLEYVDIFYHHRPDPNTPLEETLGALDLIVKQGKALYVGISNYSVKETEAAISWFKENRTPFIVHQVKYSMFGRTPENGLFDLLEKNNIGCVTFSSLAQGILTNKYLNGIPSDSRAASGRGNGALESGVITETIISKVNLLNKVAIDRGQSLAQMALSWVLRDKRVTSVILGASSKKQLEESIKCIHFTEFSAKELIDIENILNT